MSFDGQTTDEVTFRFQNSIQVEFTAGKRFLQMLSSNPDTQKVLISHLAKSLFKQDSKIHFLKLLQDPEFAACLSASVSANFLFNPENSFLGTKLLTGFSQNLNQLLEFVACEGRQNVVEVMTSLRIPDPAQPTKFLQFSFKHNFSR